MSEQPPKPKQGLDTILESLHGFNKAASFGKALEGRAEPDLSNKMHEKEILDSLSQQGIPIPLNALPSGVLEEMRKFTNKEWEYVRGSEDQVIALYTVRNYIRAERIIRRNVRGEDSQYDAYPPRHIGASIRAVNARDLAQLRALPLVHGTSMANLDRILAAGAIKTNREVYEGRDGTTEEFIDATYQRTTAEDRELGLDRYVFADFGRPHPDHPQLEATLVLDPALMETPGAFATKDDYLDTGIQSSSNPLKTYTDGISSSPYFYEQALAQIRETPINEWNSGRGSQSQYNSVNQFAEGIDQMSGNMGQVAFATWEVKLPSVPVSAIRKIIFKNEADFTAFVQKHGDAIPAVLEPNLKPSSLNEVGNMAETVSIDGEFERRYRLVTAGDFEKRKNQLEVIPPSERKTVYVPLDEAEGEYKSGLVDERTNPFSINTSAYDSLEEMPLRPDGMWNEWDLPKWNAVVALVEVPSQATSYTTNTPSRIVGFRTLNGTEYEKDPENRYRLRSSSQES